MLTTSSASGRSAKPLPATQRGAWLRIGIAAAMVASSAMAHAFPGWGNSKWPGGDWPMFGHNERNTASSFSAPIDVKKLSVKWSFTAGGDVSARAAVSGGLVYFPDWGGNLWALDAQTGKAVWSHKFSDFELPANTQSRTTPAVVGDVLYTATQEGAWLLAVHAKTGKLLWKTQLESPQNDALAIVTASPVVVDGVLYTGLASGQENAAASPAFACCNARGSVVAVSVEGRRKGQILWRTYTVPQGYSGGAVFGSNFAVDRWRGTVFVGTGNNYHAPTDPAYLACTAAGGTPDACMSADNHVDSIVALDTRTGRIRWSQRATQWQEAGVKDGSDEWNVACIAGFPPGAGNCPAARGPDYDFASAPNLVSFFDRNGGWKTIVGAGQKSGIYYAFDPDTGKELWRTQVGPGSSLGGMEWGSATDGRRIYVSIGNLNGVPTPVGGAGSWSALDPATGKILWQVGEPNGAVSLGPVTVAAGAVFVSSMAGSATAPNMFALNPENGQTLWSHAAGASVIAGASVADGVVYWGSGYGRLGIPGFTAGNKFYAFSLRGR